MQIPADLKAAHRAYHKECEAKNVAEATSNFLLGDDTPHWTRAFLQKAADDLLAAEYNLYVAACIANNIEPVLKDFLLSEIPDGVISLMEHVENEVEPVRKEALAASA
jgi:hypothetical protein